MEAGQHCINGSDAVCPWHRDSLNVDWARGIHLVTQPLLIFNAVDPRKRAGLSDCCWVSSLLQPSAVAWQKANEGLCPPTAHGWASALEVGGEMRVPSALVAARAAEPPRDQKEAPPTAGTRRDHGGQNLRVPLAPRLGPPLPTCVPPLRRRAPLCAGWFLGVWLTR